MDPVEILTRLLDDIPEVEAADASASCRAASPLANLGRGNTAPASSLELLLAHYSSKAGAKMRVAYFPESARLRDQSQRVLRSLVEGAGDRTAGAR